MKNTTKFKVIVALSVLLVFTLCSYQILSNIWSSGSYDIIGLRRSKTQNGVLNVPLQTRKGHKRKQNRSEKNSKNQKLDQRQNNFKLTARKIIPFSVNGKKEFYKKQKKRQCGVGWQERYVEYHKHVIESKKPGRFLVYFCGGKDYGCGGYGNRLHAITSLLLLAILTDRVFLIHWNYSISLKDYFLPNRVNWKFSPDALKGLSSRRNYWGAGNPSLVTADVRRPFKDHSEFKDFIVKTDFRKHFNQPVEIVTAMWYFTDALKENRYLNGKLSEMALGDLQFSWIGCAFDFLFIKTKNVEERLEEAMKVVGFGQGTPVIGVHIRTGDEVFGKRSRKGAIRTKNYMKLINCAFNLQKAILKANPQLSDSRVRIFLASDDVKLKSFLLKKYPTFVSLEVKIEHISMFRRKKRLPSKEGMIGVLLDHFLLSECDFLVLSRSTFGLTAVGLTFHLKETYTLGEKCKY